MLKDRRCVNRRRTRLLRTAAIIIGFGCTIHLAHRECAKVTEKPVPNRALAGAVTESTPATPPEVFHATAYCVSGVTRTGVMAAPGHVAADPRVIPLGSMIYVDSPLMGGIYQVRDTGELVKGKIIDIFIPSYERCVEFGRRMVKVKILRYGFLGYPPEKKSGK